MKKILNEIAIIIAEKVNDHIKLFSKGNEESCDDDLLTTEQVCKKLHISRATLYRHRRAGLITPTCYVGRKPLYSNKSIIKNYE